MIWWIVVWAVMYENVIYFHGTRLYVWFWVWSACLVVISVWWFLWRYYCLWVFMGFINWCRSSLCMQYIGIINWSRAIGESWRHSNVFPGDSQFLLTILESVCLLVTVHEDDGRRFEASYNVLRKFPFGKFAIAFYFSAISVEFL